MYTTDLTTYRISLNDPNQPARCYPLKAKTILGAQREARPFLSGLLEGGVVRIQEADGEGWRTARSAGRRLDGRVKWK